MSREGRTLNTCDKITEITVLVQRFFFTLVNRVDSEKAHSLLTTCQTVDPSCLPTPPPHYPPHSPPLTFSLAVS